MGIIQRGPRQRMEQPYLRAKTWRRAPHKNDGPTTAAQRAEWGRVSDLPPVWGRALDDACCPLRWIVWVAAPGLHRAAIVEVRVRAALAVLRGLGIHRPAFARLRAVSPDLRVNRGDPLSDTQKHDIHAAALAAALAEFNLSSVVEIVTGAAKV